MAVGRFMAVFGLVGGAAAQCTLPEALPEATQFAAGNPEECVLGGELDGAGQGPCVVECVAGQSQGPDGEYSYVCTGADLTEPAPQCEACAADTYGATPGLETCTACPENSGTGGETGQTEVGACLCAAGWTGELTEPESTCEGCAADTYKPAAGPEACTACPENSGTGGETEQTEVSACLCAAGYEGEITTAESECTACLAGTWLGEIGPGPCTPCTENAVTEEAASTAITDCLCAAGHTGDIAAPEDECTACTVGSYKGGNGPATCEDCPGFPELSTTEEPASTEVSDCLCTPGHTGTIAAPEDVCDACAENTWKSNNGPEVCTDCPANSDTNGQTGSAEPSACECQEGFVGVISGPNDTCRQPGRLGAGAIVGISAAAVVGVAAAFGGIMYGKGAYERGRRYSVQQDRNDPLMPGGSNA